MYVMLFYDEYFNRWEYNLVNTEKEISELEDFVYGWLENNTNLRETLLPNLNFPYFNPMHPRIMATNGHYEVNHEFNHGMPITVSFYKINDVQIEDPNIDGYYLVLLNHEGKNWEMSLIKTDRDIMEVILEKSENKYDFKCNEINTKARRLLNNKSYVNYLWFKFNKVYEV